MAAIGGIQRAGPERPDGRRPRSASSARWRRRRPSPENGPSGVPGASSANPVDRLCIRTVLYAPWRIEPGWSAGQGIRAPSCCGCSPGTPRSKSCTSPRTRTPARAVGDALPVADARRTATSGSRRSTSPTCAVSTSCSPRCRTARRQLLVPEILDRVAHVVDLGADFRLPADVYPRWYGEPHAAPELIGRFAYGLVELYRDDLAGARARRGRRAAIRPR